MSLLLTESLFCVKFCPALTGERSLDSVSADPLLPSPTSSFRNFILYALADLITLFTLVLPREPLEL
jgi:hypothetical protein